MDIRRLAEPDLERVGALYARIFNEPPWNDGWTARSAGERLKRIMENPDAMGVVAVDGDEALGFALGVCERWSDGEHFHLKEMCTAPEIQRKGIGSAVLDALSAQLRNRQVRAIYLQTAPDSPADTFYRKHGFRVIELHTMVRNEVSA